MRHAAVVVLCACAGQPTVTAHERGEGPENVVPAEALPVASCDDAPLYTLADLAAGKGDGERIAVDLVPEVNGMCTLLYCPNSECCNRCDGSYGAKLRGNPDLEVRLEGLAGCGGMDCNFHCEPFGRAPTTRYRFVGANTFNPEGQTSAYHRTQLKVEKYCVLPGSATPNP